MAAGAAPPAAAPAAAAPGPPAWTPARSRGQSRRGAAGKAFGLPTARGRAELRRAPGAQFLDGVLEQRRVVRVALVDFEVQVDAEHADHRVGLGLGDVAQRGLVRQGTSLRREPVEHQRNDRRGRGRGRQLRRRRCGRGDGLAIVGWRCGLLRCKQGHRPDLLADAVFLDLEVGGRQVQDRVTAPVAHHDVHQDGRGIGLDDARRALRGRGLLLRDERRSN